MSITPRQQTHHNKNQTTPIISKTGPANRIPAEFHNALKEDDIENILLPPESTIQNKNPNDIKVIAYQNSPPNALKVKVNNLQYNSALLDPKSFQSPTAGPQKLFKDVSKRKNRKNRLTKLLSSTKKKLIKDEGLSSSSLAKMNDPTFDCTIYTKNMVNAKMPNFADFSQATDSEIDLLNEESRVDLSMERLLYTINADQMLEFRKKNHPAKDDGEPYTCHETCSISTGHHTPCGSSTNSEFNKFGVGISLYFKFLKHLLVFALIFSLLSGPALFFNIFAFTNANSDTSIDFSSAIQASTLGSIGLGGDICALATNKSTSENITLYCPNGPILNFSTFVYGYATANGTCSLLSDSDISTSCNNANQTAIQAAYQSCIGNQNCSITISQDFYDSSSTACQTKLQYSNLYFKATCDNSYISLKLGLIGTFSVDKKAVALIMTSCDAAIILLFISIIYFLRKSINVVAKNILKSTYSASSFTVEIRNLPQNMHPEKLTASLWEYIENRVNPERRENAIVDLQIVLPPLMENLILKHGEITNQKNHLIYEFYQKFSPDLKLSNASFGEVEKLANELIAAKNKKSKEVSKLFTKIKRCKEQNTKIEQKVDILENKANTQVISAYVTFNTKELKQKALNIFSETYIARLCNWFFGCFINKATPKYFHKKLLSVSHAEDPSNILWKNLGLSFSNRMFRKLISYSITILLWCGTCALIITTTNLKKEYLNNYPTASCKNSIINSLTLTQIQNDYNMGSEGSGYLECYCSADLTNRINQVFPNGKQLCQYWIQAKLYSFGVTFITIFGVLVINIIMQQFFGLLSKFERHKTVTELLGSTAIKIFCAQFLNTGLLILILNSKFDLDSWLFQGIYNDLTPSWYRNIGSTIILTMLINAFSVPTSKVCKELVLELKRLCDRGCTSDIQKTKKKTQKEYNNLYLGSQFVLDTRYAQILNVVFVCLLYSSGMPALYVTSFLDFSMNYLVDKWILLKRARNPTNYNQELELMMRKILYAIVIIHLAFAIWNYGNPLIFQSADYFYSNTGSLDSLTSSAGFLSSAFKQKIYTRFLQKHNFSLVLIFGTLIGIYFIKILVFDILSGIYKLFCMKDNADHMDSQILMKINPQYLYAILEKFKLKVYPIDEKSNVTLQNDTMNFISVSDQATYIEVLTLDNLSTLIRLNKASVERCDDPEYLKLLKQKIDLFKNELEKKKLNILKELQKKTKFIGLYTYDLRENPLYKELYQVIEGLNHINVDDQFAHVDLDIYQQRYTLH